MLFPLTWMRGDREITVRRKEGPECDHCTFPAEFSVTESRPYTAHHLCSRHVTDYLYETDRDAVPWEFGSVRWTSDKIFPVRVGLATAYEDAPLQWKVQIEIGGAWESYGGGYSKLQRGAIISWLEWFGDDAVSLDPPVKALYRIMLARKDAERKAKQEAAEAESRRQEEESRRSNTFWAETEARARAMKGKRGTISLLKYHRESSPSHLDPVREDVKGTIYGDLAIHHEGSRFALTHVPTGLSVGKPFPSQIEARMAVCLLRESGIDWGSLTAKLSDDERTIIGTLLHAVEDRQVPEYTKIGAVA